MLFRCAFFFAPLLNIRAPNPPKKKAEKERNAKKKKKRTKN